MLCISHSIVTGAQLLCSCVLVFVLLTSGVLAVVCHWEGEKIKSFCMDEGFCVTAKSSDCLQDSSDQCNSAPYRGIFKTICKTGTLRVENMDSEQCYQLPA